MLQIFNYIFLRLSIRLEIFMIKNKNSGTKLVIISIEYHLSKCKLFVFEFEIT